MAADTADTTRSDQESPAGGPALNGRDDRRARRLAHQITAFAKGHGGSAEGQLAHIARGSVRIALVGANGEWGNLVAPSFPVAQRAAELAKLPLQDDFGGELAAKVRTGPYEWSRMAGIQVGGPSNG
ncbi:hypothetical protein RKE29_05320 [Streptomyces sp. B1866]|uniref:hypothetical protein n=1 Tax=Streptomyces sp. B1866 TaxID=3075431 RepID=UPI002890A4F2|nr:hypothetical protein [Streptomyces sp. B1866]MDT3396066.1 hypothetical protein [Streptomyces sp. B1866]